MSALESSLRSPQTGASVVPAPRVAAFAESWCDRWPAIKTTASYDTIARALFIGTLLPCHQPTPIVLGALLRWKRSRSVRSLLATDPRAWNRSSGSGFGVRGSGASQQKGVTCNIAHGPVQSLITSYVRDFRLWTLNGEHRPITACPFPLAHFSCHGCPKIVIRFTKVLYVDETYNMMYVFINMCSYKFKICDHPFIFHR